MLTERESGNRPASTRKILRAFRDSARLGRRRDAGWRLRDPQLHHPGAELMPTGSLASMIYLALLPPVIEYARAHCIAQ
jgi:hypothetical protein